MWCPPNNPHRPRRGTILVTTMWVTIILAGVVVAFARSMRVEASASANRVASLQAAAVERAGEQWALAQIEATPGDALTITSTPAEAIRVGGGYFWILGFNPDSNDTTRYYGIIDESSKLNVNSAPATAVLNLPAVTSDLADCLIDWRDTDENPQPQGAESSYYQMLPEPYSSKNGPLESVEELLLVKGFTKDVLWGYDANRNGVLEPRELTGPPPDSGTVTTPSGLSNSGLGNGGGGMAAAFNAAQQDAGRGIFPFVTVYSAEPNTTAAAKPMVDVTASMTAVRNALRTPLGAAKADAAVQLARGQRPIRNVIDFAFKAGLKSADLAKVAGILTSGGGKVRTGLINVSTAPRPVLMCLPQLTAADADALIAKRGTTDAATLNTIAWVMDALPKAKAVAIGGLITARSFQYSADIVGVSGDGRAYKRARVVIDSSTLPAKIVYRKDLTPFGWPFDPIVRTAMRSGQPPPDATPSTNAPAPQ